MLTFELQPLTRHDCLWLHWPFTFGPCHRHSSFYILLSALGADTTMGFRNSPWLFQVGSLFLFFSFINPSLNPVVLRPNRDEPLPQTMLTHKRHSVLSPTRYLLQLGEGLLNSASFVLLLPTPKKINFLSATIFLDGSLDHCDRKHNKWFHLSTIMFCSFQMVGTFY